MRRHSIDTRKLARAAALIVLAWLAGVLFFAAGYYLRTDWPMASNCLILLMLVGAAAYLLQFQQIDVRRDRPPQDEPRISSN